MLTFVGEKLCLRDTHVHGPGKGGKGRKGVFALWVSQGSSIVCACGMFGSGYPIPLRGMRFIFTFSVGLELFSLILQVLARAFVRCVRIIHMGADWACSCAKDGWMDGCTFLFEKRVVNVNEWGIIICGQWHGEREHKASGPISERVVCE